MLLSEAINDFIEKLKARDYSKNTTENYRYTLKQLEEWLNEGELNNIPLENIKKEDFEEYLLWHKEKGATARYRNKMLSIFKSFYGYIDRNDLGDNVVAGIRKIKTKSTEREFLTEDEFERVLTEMQYPHIKFTTLFIYCTGARINECLQMRLNNLDFVNKVIIIKEGKGKKDRRIAMSKRLEDNLRIYINDLRPEVDTDKVFVTPRSGGLSRKYYNSKLKEAVREAGINKSISAHSIRHSTAVSLIKNDVPLSTIQEILGHESLETTSVYLHSDLSDMQNAVDVL